MVLGECSISFICLLIFSFPITICWIDFPFSFERSWHLVQKLFNNICRCLFLGSLFHQSMSVFMPVPHCFDYHSFVVKFFKDLLIYFEMERESVWECPSGGGAEGEGERESQANSSLSAEALAGLSIMAWAEITSGTLNYDWATRDPV